MKAAARGVQLVGAELARGRAILAETLLPSSFELILASASKRLLL